MTEKIVWQENEWLPVYDELVHHLCILAEATLMFDNPESFYVLLKSLLELLL